MQFKVKSSKKTCYGPIKLEVEYGTGYYDRDGKEIIKNAVLYMHPKDFRVLTDAGKMDISISVPDSGDTEFLKFL